LSVGFELPGSGSIIEEDFVPVGILAPELQVRCSVAFSPEGLDGIDAGLLDDERARTSPASNIDQAQGRDIPRITANRETQAVITDGSNGVGAWFKVKETDDFH